MTQGSLGLDFAPISHTSRRSILCLLLILVVTFIVALSYFDIRQTVVARRSEMKQREVSSIVISETPLRSAEEIKSLQQEVNVVNKQIRQLNQRWDRLLNDLRVFPDGNVSSLSLEVNAVSGVIRYFAVAENVETMTDYAAYLADKKTLQAVLISRHEMDAQGLRFMVDAKWAERL